MKVSIIGTGYVGSTLAYTLVVRGLVDELMLVNRDHAVAVGESLDLMHSEAFLDNPVAVKAGKLADTAKSDILIITASVKVHAGIKSRMELAEKNVRLFQDLIPPLVKLSPDAVVLVITNPVDVMTYVALKMSQFPPERVFGTGTIIDSARFRSLLSQQVEIHPGDIRAYVLGEHGDSQFPALSLALSGGEWVGEHSDATQAFERTIQIGYEVMRQKGHTNYAISLAAALVIDSIVHDSRRTMPLSTLIDGFLGVHDVCISVPVVIGRKGIVRQLHPDLNKEEVVAFQNSAAVVKDMIRQVQ